MTKKNELQTNLNVTIQRAELVLKIKELIDKGIPPSSIGLSNEQLKELGIDIENIVLDRSI